MMTVNAALDKEAAAMPATVVEKAFDEFHLYTLQNPVTLRDRDTKQVEFVHATGVSSQKLFVYDGAQFPDYGWNYETVRNDRGYGTQSNPKVWIMQEFKNTKSNGLGIPLPKGTLRFYRRDDDGRLEFTGENVIDHTPSDETVRVYTGNAFDIVGERKQTDYRINVDRHFIDETYEIHVRNHKKESVEVRAVEHMFRCDNWELTSKSQSYRKLDSHRIEFPLRIAANGEAVITYTVHYTW
jgi:hypothetical protein